MEFEELSVCRRLVVEHGQGHGQGFQFAQGPNADIDHVLDDFELPFPL